MGADTPTQPSGDGGRKDLEEQLAIFSALAGAYTNVYLIYAKTRKVRVLKLDGYVTTGIEKAGDAVYDYDIVEKQYVAERVHPSDRDMMYEAIDLDRVKECLRSTSEYSGNYRVLLNSELHYCQYKYIQLENADYIIAGFQNIDEIVAAQKRQHEKEKAHQQELEEQLAIFNILSRNYRNVYLANINDGTAKILKVATDYDLEEVVALKNRVFPYESVLGFWINHRVHAEDKERLRQQLSVENLRKVLAGRETLMRNLGDKNVNSKGLSLALSLSFCPKIVPENIQKPRSRDSGTQRHSKTDAQHIRRLKPRTFSIIEWE